MLSSLVLWIVMTAWVADEFRTWTDHTGNFQVEAKLIDTKQDSIQLEKRNGSVVTVPIERLSQADRQYLSSLSKPAEQEPPKTVQLSTRLQQPASFEFKDQPLQQVVDKLSEQFQVPIFIDLRSVEDFGVPPDTPLTYQSSEQTLATELDGMFQPLGLTWTLQDDVLIISSDEHSPLTAWVYRITDATDADDMVMRLIAISPDSWADVGGRASVVSYGNLLVVSQTQANHNVIQQEFNEQLQWFYQPRVWARHDMRVSKIDRLLTTRVSVNWTDIMLGEAAEKLSRKTNGINVALDKPSLDDELALTDKDYLGNFSVEPVRVRSLLNLLCRHMSDLDWYQTGEGIVICGPATARSRLHTVEYDLAKVADDPDEQEAMVQLIQEIIAPDRWRSVGGVGQIELTSPMILQVEQTPKVHGRIEDLLASMEAARGTAK